MDVTHRFDPESRPDDYDPWLCDDRDVVVRALDLAPDPVVVVEVARDGSPCPARIAYANHAFAALLGVPAADLPGRELRSAEVAGVDPDAWAVLEVAVAGLGGSRVTDVVVPTRDGGRVEFEAGISPLQVGGVSHHVMVVLRRTGSRAYADGRRTAPHHDPLTGLPDRFEFLERLHHSLRPLRTDEVAVLILALDGLDVEGGASRAPRRGGPDRPRDAAIVPAAVPDDVALEVAERLEQAVRGDDFVARLAPDRFGVLCESLTDADEARRVLRRIRRYLAAPMEVDREAVTVAVSHGVAVSHPRDQAESVLARAEAALSVTPLAVRVEGSTA